MARAVLDSSAILAVLRRESGWERVDALFGDAIVSVVNEAEVISKLIWRGDTPEAAQQTASRMPYEVVPLDRDLARRAGVLWDTTRRQGLSLGDRCCLALAEREGLPALTTDKAWANITLNVEVKIIR
jgi:PIN domain nuclease of toxin-antitoxin system